MALINYNSSDKCPEFTIFLFDAGLEIQHTMKITN